MGVRDRLDWPLAVCVAASAAIVGFGAWFASNAHDRISEIEHATVADCVDTVTQVHGQTNLDACEIAEPPWWPADAGPADMSLIRSARTPSGR
ncbi:hypothetical protein [Mycolicibacterium parafortuitum]|uniref:Uncharacterized protein n=1 Tax=Mycolicibacterium parafortuitum TaxID=39692 RepID=A0A375YMX4_MYCPF|nr:hypothetical protein [Mycolicibacterium parafortuitum]ORB28580.1 hypothetical protein BST38_19210 [Mycolicibacterium parafortuitum]SRX82452.1 hypothetical protein MPP7335_04212 [Mycolicibacterium parafortuitum]